MHENNFYPLVDPDSQIVILLAEQLRRGTQLQSCEATQYIHLLQRVVDRLSYFVKKFLNKAFIDYNNGVLERSGIFEIYWEKRQKIWDGHLYGILSPSSTRESSPAAETSVISNTTQLSSVDSGYWTAGRIVSGSGEGSLRVAFDQESTIIGLPIEKKKKKKGRKKKGQGQQLHLEMKNLEVEE
jgi:hypothetical protein